MCVPMCVNVRLVHCGAEMSFNPLKCIFYKPTRCVLVCYDKLEKKVNKTKNTKQNELTS